MASFGDSISSAWKELQQLSKDKAIIIDGASLTLAQVISVAYATAEAELAPSVRDRVMQSVAGLENHLAAGNVVYGVNTGFGGSADTHTTDHASLQQSLLQMQQCGILTKHDVGKTNTGDISSQSMPTSWVKGAMLIRCNSLIRGHSAVRIELIEGILNLLANDVTPIIPIRGSISASGDLSPLSYIAGVLVGNPDVYIRMGRGNEQRILSADRVLKELAREPLILGPKEGLGLINGTAECTSVATLALWQANQIAVLSQVSTAMAVEALRGRAESFHPFIAKARPHPGQTQAAHDIYAFLGGSKLVKPFDNQHGTTQNEDREHATMTAVSHNTLAQDRYSTRTASQWIGPQLEDLLLAHQQISVELNSTTDNPLVDATGEFRCFNGGNFQAVSITSAMEKARSALQMLGKMMFAQCIEIINPAFNNGLPPNLAPDDPSLSFTCKGIDISMAAYMSELAFLANTVSTHVQSAEMHNQAINSLALISASKTMEAVDVLSMMSASFLFVLCQALDLRVLQEKFFHEAQAKLQAITADIFQNHCYNNHSAAKSRELGDELWKNISQSWGITGTSDLQERCEKAVAATAVVLLNGWAGGRFNTEHHVPSSHLLILCWQERVKAMLEQTYNEVRQVMFEEHAQVTPAYLGLASKKMYAFIRGELGVPMHRGLADGPTFNDTEGRKKLTVGSWVSMIFEALNDGRLHQPLMECLKEIAEVPNGVC